MLGIGNLGQFVWVNTNEEGSKLVSFSKGEKTDTFKTLSNSKFSFNDGIQQMLGISMEIPVKLIVSGSTANVITGSDTKVDVEFARPSVKLLPGISKKRTVS